MFRFSINLYLYKKNLSTYRYFEVQEVHILLVTDGKEFSMAAAPVCINDQFLKNACYCLNESAPNQYTNLFVGDHTLGVKSDSDEQLIIHIAFLQTFKLSGISFGIPGDGSCPATVKLFANANNLGFSDAAGEFLSSRKIISFCICTYHLV